MSEKIPEIKAGGTGNRGFDTAVQAQKLQRLHETYRDVRDGVSYVVQGIGTMQWQCACGTVNTGRVWQAATCDIYCTTCQRETEQERYRGA